MTKIKIKCKVKWAIFIQQGHRDPLSRSPRPLHASLDTYSVNWCDSITRKLSDSIDIPTGRERNWDHCA